jgi:putative protease
LKKKVEILAPAGSYEGLTAALNAGCDAVYIGGTSFGARAYANNLDEEDMLRAIDAVHIRDKQLYLTVNTLVKQKEIEENLYRFIEKFYLQGLDAVIVQDVGVIHFLHKHFPKLPIHASTQMTLMMAQGADLLKDCGVTRMVTARELTLAEIISLRANTSLEIETFVHGALCYCYSGQCLMSSMIGGRSGNRGRCAQPCRMPYRFFSGDRQISSDREKYLLSPKDINTVSLIPELLEAGIDSFKIEGRMKRPEYAAGVSAIYRKYVDLYDAVGRKGYAEVLRKDDFARDMITLQDLYNRGGFCEGYAKTRHGKEMMSLYRPNHSGVHVGDVTTGKSGRVCIALKEDINAQDVLEFRSGEEKIYEFTVKDPHRQGEILIANVGRNPIAAFSKAGVYRMKNNMLLERIAHDDMEENRVRAVVGYLTAMAGEALTLTVTCGDVSVTAYHNMVQEALKQPTSREKLLAPVRKTGGTPFYFETVSVRMGDHIFVPVSWLNEIRREALRQLEDQIVRKYRRVITQTGEKPAIDNKDIALCKQPDTGNCASVQPDTGICVSVQSDSQFSVAVSCPEITAIYANYDTLECSKLYAMAKEAKSLGKGFYLILPSVCRLAVYEKLSEEIALFMGNDSVNGFVVKNFEEITLLQSLLKKGKYKKEIILHDNMYVYNNEAMLFWMEKGITRFSAPVEQNGNELKSLLMSACDMVVYGYLPLIISAQCLQDNTGGCRKNQSGYLVDRMGKKFLVQTNCKLCYNTIYNGQCLSLINQMYEIRRLHPANIRLDFTMETKEEMMKILEGFLNAFYGGGEKNSMSGCTTGHFKRGTE